MPTLSGSAALDTAIGLAFLFALLALVASGINELLARWLNLRSRNLEKALKQLLTKDPDTVRKVLTHPLVEVLGDPGKSRKYAKMPSYIPSRAFAVSVLDLLVPATESDDALKKVDVKGAGLPEGLTKSLEALVRDVGEERDKLRAGIESWYDATMDRASGWYKRRAQTFLFVIGFVIAFALNADAIQVATTLWHNPAQRAVIVNAAESAVSGQNAGGEQGGSDRDQATDTPSLDKLATRLQDVKALQLPLGWNNRAGDPRDFPDIGGGLLLKVLGQLISGLAISLGAPFWFDVIGRGISLRASGKKPVPSHSTITQ
jgi:hypothetical protein